eukprot:CAMPEP_0201514324 /NCGR_PEP_ID=MMETSP0161_2-20130828/6186_1 /ASSEMBLY_ACC=CAM_ASM_000251 /TAXON_ID=180227 /ORGANISM="Neoparamoeba aestuarina, Strain SoJaBio B1-5/56/2" /LENGTH=126 /DNA_ID=CAMNT_0047910851 /DNA_START=162 /DNA_END=539 /DNA_ORIENTATION=-
MNLKEDELHLLTVPISHELPASNAAGLGILYPQVVEEREEEKKKCSRLLHTYAAKAHEAGITGALHLTIGQGEVGDALCDYVKTHNIDFLVMGRRGGRGKVERFMLGSSSKKCVEEAECNVIIVKQ